MDEDWREERRRRLNAGERVSSKPKEPVFRRKKADPWLTVKKDDRAAELRACRPRIPK